MGMVGCCGARAVRAQAAQVPFPAVVVTAGRHDARDGAMLGAGELAAFLVSEGRDSWPADGLRTDKSAAPQRCDEMSGRAGECGGPRTRRP